MNEFIDRSRASRRVRSPGVLLPYQRAWVADRAAVKVMEKGRRTGISWTEAAEDALLAAASAETGGMDVYYIGYSREMAREFVDDAAGWARHYNLAARDMGEFVFEETDPDGDKRSIQAFRVAFDSGFSIVALSSRPRSLRGIQGKIVIDEAAFHDDLPGLLKAAMAMLIWGGRVVVISTHNGEDNTFNELVQEIRAGKKPYSLHRVDFDQAIAQGLCRRVFEKLGRTWTRAAEATWREKVIAFYRPNEDEELFCVPARGGGAYLPRALLEACMEPGIPVIRWEPPPSFAELRDHTRVAETRDWCETRLAPALERLDPGLRSFFGEDFGRIADLTDIWPVQLAQDLRRLTPFLVELRNVPFEQQKQILFYIVDRLPRFSGGAMDAGGNGAYLAEVAWQRYGTGMIERVTFSTEWYRENMPRYKAAIEDRMMQMPRDADVMDDHRAIVMEKGVARVPDARTRGRDRGQRHGDSAIAGALAYYATVRDAQPPAGEEVLAEADTYAPAGIGHRRPAPMFGRRDHESLFGRR